MPGGEQTFFCIRTYVRKRIERLFLRVTNVCSYKRKNVCSYKKRTFVLHYNEQMFDTTPNICSEIGQPEQERMLGHKEHMF